MRGVVIAISIQKRSFHNSSAIFAGKKSLSAVRAQNATISLPNKHAIVVGGTSGIGEGMAHRFAKANVSVTIIGRSKARGEEIVKTLASLSSSKEANHGFIACDSFLMKNIQTACEEIKSKQQSLDYLVLSQGISAFQRTDTPEGIDQKLALHYFGRVMFIRELLPILRHAAEVGGDISKVMSVLTPGVHKPYKHYQSDFELIQNYSAANSADAGCFYNDLAMDAFSHQPGNERIAFIHSAPGFVSTNLGRDLPWIARIGMKILSPLARTPEDCAEILCDPFFNRTQAGLFLMDKDGGDAKKTNLHNDQSREFILNETMKVLDRVITK